MSNYTKLVFIINDPVVGLGLLRTARFGGYKVNVIARKGCRWLRWTAACQQFFEVDESRIEQELLSILRERGFDEPGYTCLAAGDIATQALIKISSALRAATQHAMDAEARLSIGNKADFSKICNKLSIPTPTTWIVDKKQALLDLLADKNFSFPVIVKAVNMSGSIGIRNAENSAELHEIVEDPNYNFSPLVVQEFIRGYDVGFSLIAENGQIRSGYTQKRSKGGDTFPRHNALLEYSQLLCESMNYSGPANIDARIDADGNIYIIECNARFWATSPLSYLLGIDLIAEGHTSSNEGADVMHHHDNTYFSLGNALRGMLFLGPMGSEKARRYFKSIFADLPGLLFTKVPASRKYFAR
jgi:biotin carboxylase